MAGCRGESGDPPPWCRAGTRTPRTHRPGRPPSTLSRVVARFDHRPMSRNARVHAKSACDSTDCGDQCTTPSGRPSTRRQVVHRLDHDVHKLDRRRPISRCSNASCPQDGKTGFPQVRRTNHADLHASSLPPERSGNTPYGTHRHIGECRPPGDGVGGARRPYRARHTGTRPCVRGPERRERCCAARRTRARPHHRSAAVLLAVVRGTGRGPALPPSVEHVWARTSRGRPGSHTGTGRVGLRRGSCRLRRSRGRARCRLDPSQRWPTDDVRTRAVVGVARTASSPWPGHRHGRTRARRLPGRGVPALGCTTRRHREHRLPRPIATRPACRPVTAQAVGGSGRAFVTRDVLPRPSPGIQELAFSTSLARSRNTARV